MENNARQSNKKTLKHSLLLNTVKKSHASKVLPQFHTPSDTVCSSLETCHRGERTLVLSSLIWLNECFAPCGECTFLLKIIMGCITDRDPATFLFSFILGTGPDHSSESVTDGPVPSRIPTVLRYQLLRALLRLLAKRMMALMKRDQNRRRLEER